MATWWLIPEDVQEALHEHLWKLVDPILNSLANHNHETAVVGALGQALLQHPLQVAGISIGFDYRKFPERGEEFTTGADGAIVVTVTPRNGPPTQKAAIFQAKLLRDDLPPRDQELSRTEASRLSQQARKMAKVTDDAVGLLITADNIYIVDAASLGHCTATQLRRPLRESSRLITLETYLGRWLPRCTRGDQRPDFLARAARPGGFRHVLSMNVVSEQPLLPLSPMERARIDAGPLHSHRRKPR